METIEISRQDFESSNTPEEILQDNALGDRRKKRIAKKAQTLAKKKTTKRLTKREAKQLKTAGTKVKKIQKRQVRRKAVKEKVTSALKKTGFAVLLPLRPVMEKSLKRHGLNGKGMPIEKLATEFYNKIVVKNSGGHYEEVIYEPDTDAIVGTTITAIVAAIIGFVKSLKRQKDEGEKLTPAQDEIVKGVEVVQDRLVTEAKIAGAEDVGRTLFLDNKILLIGAAVVLLLILRK